MKKMQREYKVIDFPPLTAEEKATLERLDKLPDSEINFSDIPPSTPENNGGFYYIQALKMPKTAPFWLTLLNLDAIDCRIGSCRLKPIKNMITPA